MEKPANVDVFIANAAPEAQPVLAELREMIKKAFPGITEKIGYNVPQYKIEGITFGMSAAKKHVTLGFDYGAVSDEMRKRLESKGYQLGLQTLQIKFTQKVPREELQGIFAQLKKN